MQRRRLEAFAVGDWCQRRHKDPHTYTQLITTLGDFKVPKREQADPLFATLTGLGLLLPGHSSKIASSISTDAEYDQIAFLPGPMGDRTSHRACSTLTMPCSPPSGTSGGRCRARSRGAASSLAYLRYYMSDHRPIWAQFRF